jgi:4-methyl-5(b-hydroxyethyl)-thiazole monophosphate biosynthesis
MTSFLFLAQGFEEIEALATVDLMRRAGMDVKTVSITDNKAVVGAHGMSVVADTTIEEAQFTDVDWLIAPGGMPGATNLHNCVPLNDLLVKHAANDGNIAAICAAPAVVLAPLGLLKGVEATCYPGFEAQCKQYGAKPVDRRFVVSGNIITANGPSSALHFALAIIGKSLGVSASQDVAQGVLLNNNNAPYYF